MKTFDPRGLSVPAPGLYTCIRPPFSNISTETAWPIKAKFYVEHPWEGGTSIYISGPGHFTKMVAMPIYGTTFKKLLLQNRKSYDLRAWHAASETQAITDDPGLTLTYFTARSNWVAYTFELGKLLQRYLMGGGGNMQQRTR